MRSRSDLTPTRASGFLALTFVALFVVASPVLGSLVTTNIFVVSDSESVNEDVYVTSTKGIIEGTINGDLTIFTGDLFISGTVTGSVSVFSSATVTVTEEATIGGSLRGAAINVNIHGDVGSDLFITAAATVVEESGTIGRDAMVFGGVVRIEGVVGRDLRGRTVRAVVDGTVGGDVDIATQKFEVGSAAIIGGDVQYRSQVDGSISADAQVSGSVKRLPTQSNFLYGVILALANLIGFLGFVVVGLVALFAARGSATRASGAVITNPIKTFLWGFAAVVAAPVVTILLAATLVGLPLALLLVMVMIAGLIVGPVPTVTALGNRVLLKRGGLLGAFVVGAVLWRLAIWLVPMVGGVIFVLTLVWGVGAWIVGILAERESGPIPMNLLPASMIPSSDVPDDWEPPLAPLATGFSPHDEIVEDDAIDQADDGKDEDVVSAEADHEGTELTVDVVQLEKRAPRVPESELDAVSEDDSVSRRRAEFEELLDSSVKNSQDDEDSGSSDDEWGLPKG